MGQGPKGLDPKQGHKSSHYLTEARGFKRLFIVGKWTLANGQAPLSRTCPHFGDLCPPATYRKASPGQHKPWCNGIPPYEGEKKLIVGGGYLRNYPAHKGRPSTYTWKSGALPEITGEPALTKNDDLSSWHRERRPPARQHLNPQPRNIKCSPYMAYHNGNNLEPFTLAWKA